MDFVFEPNTLDKLDSLPTEAPGQPGGLAGPLDGSGDLPASQLPPVLESIAGQTTSAGKAQTYSALNTASLTPFSATAGASTIPLSKAGGNLATGFLATGTATAGYAPLSNGSGDAVWGSVSSAGTPSIVITGSNLSLGANYELLTNPFRLANFRRRTFSPLARAVNVSAGSEFGWTNLNFSSTNLGTCDENITTANCWRVQHKAVTTAWNGATRTAPFRYRTVNQGGGVDIWYVFRIKNNASVNGQVSGALVCQDDDRSKFQALWFGWLTGAPKVESFTGSSVTAALGGSDLANGVWGAISISDGGTTRTYYNTTNQATPPTTGWTLLQTATSLFTSNVKVLDAGLVILGAAGGAYNTDVCWFSEEPITAQANPLMAPNAYWGAQGFDSTPTEIQLVTDADMGTTAPLVNQAQLRSMLTDMVNRVSGDSAVWTFSAKQSASPGATSGTFYDSSAIVLSGTGRYFSLWAKCLSTGNVLPGSLLLPGIVTFTP